MTRARALIERAAGNPVARRIALLAAAALTALALLGPRPMLPRRVFDGVVVLDITQSMNTLDALLDGRPASRLVFAKAKLRQALARMPCGSRLGWGVFTEYRSYVLTLPVEVCGSYAELAATLERIDNTMAWAGGSEITKGLMSALRISALIPEHPAVVFVPDGHEAPPLAAQGGGLRDKIAELFIFGSGGDPLFLAGSADPNNPVSIQAHGTHFIPSSVAQNGSIILQHDGGGDRSETLAALPQEIDTLKREGFGFVTIPQLLGLRLIYR